MKGNPPGNAMDGPAPPPATGPQGVGAAFPAEQAHGGAFISRPATPTMLEDKKEICGLRVWLRTESADGALMHVFCCARSGWQHTCEWQFTQKKNALAAQARAVSYVEGNGGRGGGPPLLTVGLIEAVEGE